MIEKTEDIVETTAPKAGAGDGLFGPDPVRLEPCTFAECPAGHRWTPALAIGACPGDKSPVLAIQKVNCPICNEPMIKTSIRTDFVPRGAGISCRCQGQEPQGESLDLTLTHSGWREAETSTLNFEAKRATERSGPKPK